MKKIRKLQNKVRSLQSDHDALSASFSDHLDKFNELLFSFEELKSIIVENSAPIVNPDKEKLAREISIKNGLASGGLKELCDSSEQCSEPSYQVIPKVKFRYDPFYSSRLSILFDMPAPVLHDCFGVATNYNGYPFVCFGDLESYNSCPLEEVSVYEAIPGLIPYDMVYDKKNNCLVKKA